MLVIVGPRSKPRRQPVPTHPDQIAREYADGLISLVDDLGSHFLALGPQLAPLLASHRARLRGDQDEAAQAQKVLAQAAAQLRPANISDLVSLIGKRTTEWSKRQVARQVRAAIGADVLSGEPNLTPTLNTFATTNAELAKDLTTEGYQRITKTTMAVLQAGQSWEDLRDQLQAGLAISKKRATLIARDQVGKLYGQTNAIRHQDLGVDDFWWRTSHDERVRLEHRELDGQHCSYKKPPEEGIPGTPIQCRCYGEPDFSQLLAGL